MQRINRKREFKTQQDLEFSNFLRDSNKEFYKKKLLTYQIISENEENVDGMKSL